MKIFHTAILFVIGVIAIAFDEASWRGGDLLALHAWTDADWPDLPEMEWSATTATAEEMLEASPVSCTPCYV